MTRKIFWIHPCLLFVWGRASGSIGCPQTCYVAQVPLTLDISSFISKVLGFQGCATAPSCIHSWLQAEPPFWYVCLFVWFFGCSKLRALSVLKAQWAEHLVEIKLAPLSLCPNLISIFASSTGWWLWCQPGLSGSRASCPRITNTPATFLYLSALRASPSSHTGGASDLWQRKQITL